MNLYGNWLHWVENESLKSNFKKELDDASVSSLQESLSMPFLLVFESMADDTKSLS